MEDMAAVLARHRADGDLVLTDLPPDEDWGRSLRRRTRRLAAGTRVLAPRTSDGGLAPDDLTREAAAAGLVVLDAVPYGVLRGGPQPDGSPLAGLVDTHAWRRLLSWLPEDPRLAGLVDVLDRTLVARLPVSASGQVLVVLERRRSRSAAEPGPDHWSRRTLAAAVAAIPGEELAPLLASPRARYLAFALLERLEVAPAAVLPAPQAEEYADWRAARAADTAATALMRAWPEGCEGRLRRGVDLTLAADYRLVGDLLTHHYHRFPEEP